MSDGNGHKPEHYTPEEFKQLLEELAKPEGAVDKEVAVKRLIATAKAASSLVRRLAEQLNKNEEQLRLMAKCLAALACMASRNAPIPTQRKEDNSIIVIPMNVLKGLNPQGYLDVVEQTRCVLVSWKEPKQLIQLTRELPKE